MCNGAPTHKLKTLAHISESKVMGGIAATIQAEIRHLPNSRAIWEATESTDVTRAAGPLLAHALYGQNVRARLAEGVSRQALARYAAEESRRLLPAITGTDVLVLHDPVCLTLAPLLRPHVGTIMWRCHVGDDHPSDATGEAIKTLMPFLEHVEHLAFLREAYVWPGLEGKQVHILPPGIDPNSRKNRTLTEGELDACAQVVTTGQNATTALHQGLAINDNTTDFLPSPSTPFILQVSRWDPLKGYNQVLEGFIKFCEQEDYAHLVLLGPHVQPGKSYAQNVTVLQGLIARRNDLPEAVKRRIHVWTFSRYGLEDEAVYVNYLQTNAVVVVQNSVKEGFGLTVTEAQIKRTFVYATSVGGLADQVVDGVTGSTIPMADPTRWADTLMSCLYSESLRRTCITGAYGQVQDKYLAKGIAARQSLIFGLDA